MSSNSSLSWGTSLCHASMSCPDWACPLPTSPWRLSLDPVDWSPGNVQKWLLWTEHQYRLPSVGTAFQELGGKELCTLSEEQFRQRSPLGGDVLHAHLDIWKSGRTDRQGDPPGCRRRQVRPGCRLIFLHWGAAPTLIWTP